ncbi:MAG: DNA-binding transcriptional LysR family regulator [Alteromonadaceae bacterium]|jgi:DNA-binding transcriptional LysR family regulator
MNGSTLRGKLSDIDLRLLRIFIGVAQSGGFAAAEIELNISRSTISIHISNLEARLGMRLCRRSRGRSDFSLTPQGEQVYDATKDMLKYLDGYRNQINAIQSRLTGRLKIALPDDWLEMSDACFDLAPVIARFKEVAPRVDLQIVTRAPNEVDFEILNGKADLGINTVHIRRLGLEYKPIFEHKSFLFCGPYHPLFEYPEESITEENITRYDLAASSYKVQSSTDNLINMFSNHAEADHMEGCLLLILSGKYIGFLPDYYAEAKAAKYHLRRLLPERFNYSAENSLIFKNGTQENAVVKIFINELISVIT